MARRHRADQVVFLERGKGLRPDQIDSLIAELIGGLAELLKRQLGVTPFAEGLVDPAIFNGRPIRRFPGRLRGYLRPGRARRQQAADAASTVRRVIFRSIPV